MTQESNVSQPNGMVARGGSGSPTEDSQEPRIIIVTIQSVMDRKNLAEFQISTHSTIRELKMATDERLGDKSFQCAFLFEGKELKDDDKILVEYGMVKNCAVKLAPKMSSGTMSRQADSSVIMLEPQIDMSQVFRSLASVIPTKLPSPPRLDTNTTMWSAEKQMEHELTRNRMKKLLKRRREIHKQPETLPSYSTMTSASGGSDNGSICGSANFSPMSSEPATPPVVRRMRQMATNTSVNPSVNVEPQIDPVDDVQPKELKLYYFPPESAKQLEIRRQDLYDPPQDRNELEQVRKRLREQMDSVCGVCRRKLPLHQQALKCRCKRVFCAKHRNAEKHKCNLDYKLAGRKKLEKENPKPELDSRHKPKPTDA